MKLKLSHVAKLKVDESGRSDGNIQIMGDIPSHICKHGASIIGRERKRRRQASRILAAFTHGHVCQHPHLDELYKEIGFLLHQFLVYYL